MIDQQLMNQHQDEQVSENEEQSEEENLNEALYDKLMESINQVWSDFQLEDGVIDNQNFKSIMTKVARH